MILTVTANTAIDRVLFIDEWLPGTPMRTSTIHTSVGGKGLDSSVALRHLGVETVALGFVAGETGEELVALLESYGIQPDLVTVGGETRTAHVIVETRHRRHSHIIAGALQVTGAHCEALLRRFEHHLPEASWVILAGSVPPRAPQDLYASLIGTAHRHGVPVLVDASGEHLRQALPACPEIAKLNWYEFERTFARAAASLEDLADQGEQVFRQEGLGALIITCGQEGMLAYTPQGSYRVAAPSQEAVNAAGAGDAASAALAWRLSAGDAWLEALRWATAAGSATVLTPGTADLRLEDARRILPQVRIDPL